MRPHGEPGDPRRRGPGPGPGPGPVQDGTGSTGYRTPPSGRHGQPPPAGPPRQVPGPPGPVPPGAPYPRDGSPSWPNGARGPNGAGGVNGSGGHHGPSDPPTAATPTPAGAAAQNGADASPEEKAEPDTILAGAGGYASRAPRSREGSSPGDGGTPADGTPGPGGRHRRGGAGSGPGRDEDGAGRRGARGKKGKKKGSFWRELPLLIVVAVVLTFVIQTFLGRIYVIPSASMERTLHGCSGCANDRVAVDKLTYRFSDPAPGDVVVFRGPPSWASNDEVEGDRSDNVLVRGAQDAASLIGLAPPAEKDFVKRVIAVAGQRVQCCDAQNRVLVDGRPLNEPYLFFQEGFGNRQEPFDPITVPAGQLWVMGDNRNNSADARVHGPIGVTDVIGKARAIVLPVSRWGGVPDTNPQATAAALGAPVPLAPTLTASSAPWAPPWPPPPALPRLPAPAPAVEPDRPPVQRPGA